ncbi:E3 ubiquitin-protein ligase cblA-like [Solenopsis invicta]|uniref:E3 ubiquitin-protein ligase cblA-like n=1 Tax=Solenopsis invicta TaxID=13686 RepID=UPI00193D8339|nr:E3 ubiquitin-protein ligase cblA-like [Solenopsis invicta]
MEHRLSLHEFLDSFSRFYEDYLYNMDMIDEEITHENNHEVCTDFLSESFNSTSEETLRTANSNINTNTIRNPLTLTQRQDSVQEELSISENAIGTDTLIDVNTVEFTIDVDTELTTNSPVTSDTHNQNTNNIPNLSRFDNDEFDDESIYNIPDDDYGYWYEGQETIAESDVPYHKVDRLSLEMGKENEGVRSDHRCTICLDAVSNQVFIPCGHICCCEDCANYIMGESNNVKKCSICKAEISSIYKVYTA